MHWDLFCQVIDNWGDLGVCWRLASQLAARGQQVRLWVDDARALRWMAPQGHAGVRLVDWRAPAAVQAAAAEPPPDVLVEAFGCEPAPELVARFAQPVPAGARPRAWINLEYLSAEARVERLHGLPSPVFHGAGRGLVKRFFYPGFTPATGGLLREPGLMARRERFERGAWLAGQGIAWRGERLLSLFCYEPPALAALLAQLAAGPQPTRLLVTSGRATAAVQACLASQIGLQPLSDRGCALSISYLPHLTQDDFDHLLWACDLNFVRGEDSLVRALWAGAPFVWQIYPQHDDAHHAKLDAFLDWLGAPPALRALHARWNGLPAPAGGSAWPASSSLPAGSHGTSAADGSALPALDAAALSDWGAVVRAARDRALAQDDLVTQLLRFAVQAG